MAVRRSIELDHESIDIMNGFDERIQDEKNDVSVQVTFQIRCTVASLDETVCVLGKSVALGDWNHRYAIPMKKIHESDKESSWETTLLLPPDLEIEYKYVIASIDKDISQWETIVGNRKMTPRVVNLALEMPCEQSSTYIAPLPPQAGPRPACTATNGNTYGTHEWMCCQTLKEKDPYWQVNLQKKMPISSILLWNPVADREKSRALFPLWILVSNTPFKEGSSLKEAKKRATTFRQFTNCGDNIQDDTKIAWYFESHKDDEDCYGQYIRVQLQGDDRILQFAEVQVLHRVDSSTFEKESMEFSHGLHTISCCQKDDAIYTHTMDDGLFGFEPHGISNESKCSLLIDKDWLSGSSGSELRLILGATAGEESIHLKQPRKHHVVLRVEKDIHAHWPRASTTILVANALSESIGNMDDILSPSHSEESVQLHFPQQPNVSHTLSRANSSHGLPARTPKNSLVQNNTFVRQELEEFLSNDSLKTIRAFRNLSEISLEKVRQKMEKMTYASGEDIITRGEERAYVYLIASGTVHILGQSTIVGEQILDTLTAGDYMGSMALLGTGIRTATCRATRDETVVFRLHRNDFIQALGKEKYKTLQEDMFTRASKEIPVVSNVLRCDADDVECKNKQKAMDENKRSEVQVFCVRIQPMDQDNCQYMLDIYDDEIVQNKEQSDPILIGTAYLLPNQFQGSNGNLSAPIVSCCGKIIGQVMLRYLLINPFLHPDNNLSRVWRNHWRVKPSLDVGHRGLGRSFHQKDGYRSATITENTLMSFILAGQLGADYIEFDVMLTKDRVPVIYHDFTVEVGLEDQTSDSMGEHFSMGIHDLTVRHLDRCKIKPLPVKSYTFKRLIHKHWNKLISSPRKAEIRTTIRNNDMGHLIDKFPRLRHVLEYVPHRVGLNVEIKYPTEISERSMRKLPVFEMNMYVDAILKTIMDTAGDRRIVFSTFDPDVCVMLQLKQARYPVLFLTCAGSSLDYDDVRQLSLHGALEFAKSEHLSGIVSNAGPLLLNTDLIHQVKSTGMLLFTWGDENSDHRNVQIQKMHGVDAVISDNVGDLTKKDGKPQK